MNTMVWLLRREFWENRAIWMIPAAIGAIMLLAALFGRVDLMSIPSDVPSRAVGENPIAFSRSTPSASIFL